LDSFGLVHALLAQVTAKPRDAKGLNASKRRVDSISGQFSANFMIIVKSTNWLKNHKWDHSETSWSPIEISKGKIQQGQNHYRRQNQSKNNYPHNPQSRCRWSGPQKTSEPVPVFKSFTVLIGT